MFAPEDKEQFLPRALEMAGKWQKIRPAVAVMPEDVEDCLTVNSFPEHHRKRLRSTNLWRTS